MECPSCPFHEISGKSQKCLELKRSASWPPEMKTLEITLENCKKLSLKHFTGTTIFA